MDILTFAPDYWEGQRHNRQYFCEELSKENRVLFVSPPFYIVDLLRKFGRTRLVRSGLKRMNANLLTYIPSKLFFTNYRFSRLNDFMKNARINTIKRTMKKWRFERPILLIWHPKFLDMVGQFNERLVVYYVYDQYSGYVGGNPTKQDDAEIELVKRADVVFVLSKALYDEKKRWTSEIYHLPNAVDFDLFSHSRDPGVAVPVELASMPKPVIGYVGTINEKVDVSLLDHISNARPGWSIVLIGRETYQFNDAKRQFEALVSKKNVYWLGYKPYESIPKYIKGLDVCMMCYVINDWTYFGDPSKMHEYLASGKPVVATGLPAIREFSDVIAIPETKEEWVEEIEKSLHEHDEKKTRRRIRAAQENSYAARIKRASEIIDLKLQRCGGR